MGRMHPNAIGPLSKATLPWVVRVCVGGCSAGVGGAPAPPKRFQRSLPPSPLPTKLSHCACIAPATRRPSILTPFHTCTHLSGLSAHPSKTRMGAPTSEDPLKQDETKQDEGMAAGVQVHAVAELSAVSPTTSNSPVGPLATQGTSAKGSSKWSKYPGAKAEAAPGTPAGQDAAPAHASLGCLHKLLNLILKFLTLVSNRGGRGWEGGGEGPFCMLSLTLSPPPPPLPLALFSKVIWVFWIQVVGMFGYGYYNYTVLADTVQVMGTLT